MHGARTLGNEPEELGTLFSDGRDELAAFYETPEESGINAPKADFACQYITSTTPNRRARVHSLDALQRPQTLADSLCPAAARRAGYRRKGFGSPSLA